jgi:hypothetical protein
LKKKSGLHSFFATFIYRENALEISYEFIVGITSDDGKEILDEAN